MKRNVTVVVPTYNRAHLIGKTVPTYLQSNKVYEVIIVNDCSTDNTIEVVEDLIKQFPQIRLINLTKNSKQTVAKNIGMDQVTTEFIFFGDDDSFVMPGAIDELFESMVKYEADIASARALYLKSEWDLENLSQVLIREDKIHEELVNFSRMELNFHVQTNKVVEVPVCHAYFIIRTSDAKRIRFDENFIGNCFREETDFTIRAHSMGLKIIYNPYVPQFNYPRSLASGGASGMPKFKYVIYSLKNNWYFLKKNRMLIEELLGERVSLSFLQFELFVKLIKQSIRVTIRNIFKK